MDLSSIKYWYNRGHYQLEYLNIPLRATLFSNHRKALFDSEISQEHQFSGDTFEKEFEF